MPKGRSKNSGKAIAMKRKIDQSVLSEPGSPNSNHGNECKQRKAKQSPARRGRSRAAKQLNFDQKESVRQKERVGKNTVAKKTTARFMENGDEVLFEVGGQLTDFTDEQSTAGIDQNQTSMDEQSVENTETESSDEEEEVILKNPGCNVGLNNNATRADPTPGTSKNYSPGETVILPRDMEKERKEEEAGMKHFVEYMRQEGLVIVDASKMANQTLKFRDTQPRRSPIHMQSVVNRRPPQGRDDNSEITIYQKAVEMEQIEQQGQTVGTQLPDKTNNKRISSSSEEPLDTSDELDKITDLDLNSQANLNVTQFISDVRDQRRFETSRPRQSETPIRLARGMERSDRNQIQNRSGNRLGTAEANKPELYPVKGRQMDLSVAYHSALLDEDYLLVGNYVDDATRAKIANGEYVDFSKLMPKDRLNSEDDTRMEMVNKGGMSYWVPLSDKDNVAITSYAKWEQAFRVFSNIYTEYFPARSSELIQYSHTIHTAAQTYAWDNVYRYDREFRIHLSRHPNRSWRVILQQAWSMFLKDKLFSKNGANRESGSSTNPPVRRRLCYDYNLGNCTYGRRCKYDHRCSFCNKYGHGAYNCRKANRTSGGGGNGNFPSTSSNNQNQNPVKQNNFEAKDKNRWEKYEKNK